MDAIQNVCVYTKVQFPLFGTQCNASSDDHNEYSATYTCNASSDREKSTEKQIADINILLISLEHQVWINNKDWCVCCLCKKMHWHGRTEHRSGYYICKKIRRIQLVTWNARSWLYYHCSVTTATSLAFFKRQLKTFLFTKSFPEL